MSASPNRMLAAAAHFMGIGQGMAAKKSADDEYDEEMAAASDDEGGDRLDETERDEKKIRKGKKARRAKKMPKGDPSDDTDDLGASARKMDDEEDDDEMDDDEEDDEDDEEDDDGKMRKAALIADPAHRLAALSAVLRGATARAASRAAAAERSRAASIFAHPSAAKNVNFAAKLAFTTALSAEEAHGLLAEAPVASRLGERMAGVASPRLGAGGAPERTGPARLAADWDVAFRAVRR